MPHAKVLGEIHSGMIKIRFTFETHKSIPAAVWKQNLVEELCNNPNEKCLHFYNKHELEEAKLKNTEVKYMGYNK